MPIEIKNLSIKINVSNDEATRPAANRSGKKKELKKESIIQLIEQVQKLKNER